MSKQNNTIGKNIRTRREQLNYCSDCKKAHERIRCPHCRKYHAETPLTQGKLGEMIGRTRGAVNEIENGKYQPQMKTLVAFAKALMCEVKDLLEG